MQFWVKRSFECNFCLVGHLNVIFYVLISLLSLPGSLEEFNERAFAPSCREGRGKFCSLKGL